MEAGSSAGEHRPYKPGVTGSNPVSPTILKGKDRFLGDVVQFG